MKKMFLAIIVALFVSLNSLSFAQNARDVDFRVLEDEVLEGKFYPCLAIWNATLDDPTDFFYSFYLNAPAEGSVIRITVESTKLNEQTVIHHVAEEAGELMIDPIIKWNYETLATLTQGGTATMTCILEIDGKEIDRINHIVRYRPINECVYGFLENDEWIDFSVLFSLYVNEDYPVIDKILQEILAVDRDRSFVDYQGDAQDFLNQVVWVWQYFSEKGTRYSNVVNTSNVSETLGVQYVRFIDQSINNVQANCVDGSVLLASIYRKIGLDASLVFVPGHCMLAIGYPEEIDMGDYGKTGEEGGVLLIETTLMGANTDYVTSFNAAVEVMDYYELYRRMEEEEYDVINIEEARSIGFLPIQR